MSPVLLFPGQGSQSVGMGRELHRAYAGVRAVFEEASDLCGQDLAALCFKGPRSALNATENTQSAVFVLSLAIYRVLAERGLVAQAVAGHSLGEWSAATAAGCLDFAAGLALVRQRARLMAEAFERQDGAMAALDCGAVQAAELIGEDRDRLWVANLNAPAQTVVSGQIQAVERLAETARAAGVGVVRLPVGGACHTPMLAQAAAEFARLAAAAPLQAPRVPLIGNVSATPLTDAAGVRAELCAQMGAPVRWSDCIARLLEPPSPWFAEVGPGKVLKGLLLRNARDARCLTTETPRDLDALLARWEAP